MHTASLCIVGKLNVFLWDLCSSEGSAKVQGGAWGRDYYSLLVFAE